MSKKFSKLLGALVVVSTLSFSLVIPSTIASASTEIINTKTGIENVTQFAVASKFIRIDWKPGMPTTYLYNDGMYKGNLHMVGVWYDTGGKVALGGWLEGTVYCYSNCALPAGIGEKK